MGSEPVYKAEVGPPQHQSVTSGRRRRPSDIMILLVVAALAAAAGAARLDRTYLPPPSSASAGGSPGSLRAPLQPTDRSSGFLQPPFSTVSEADPRSRVPSGGYENDHQGVVVEAAAAGPRTAERPSGLGGPRPAYGSPDSRVGEAAFRGTAGPAGSQPPGASRVQYESPRFGSAIDPDPSAFHRSPGSTKPQIQIPRDPVSNTIRYQNDIGIDKFEYAFETENGIKMEGNGVSADGVKTQGGYSYTGDDGRVYSVRYTADEGGYRAEGAHLPTPPPVPAEILHALRQNARDEAGGLRDDGSYDAQKYNTADDYTKSEANGKYNEKQLNTFRERSGPDALTSGTIVNQNGEGNAEPNSNGLFNSFDSPKDGSSLPSKTFTFGSLGFDNKANKENSFVPNGQNNQLNNNRFSSQFQYLPPVGKGQSTNTYPDSYNSKDDNDVASQKKIQAPSLFEKPTAFTGPNHNGSPDTEQVTSNDKLSQTSQGTNVYGISKSPLRSDPTFNNKKYQKISDNTNIPNRGIAYQSGSPSLEGLKAPSDFNSKSQTSFGDSSPSLISNSSPYIDIKPYKEYNSNVPVSGFNSGFSQNIPGGNSKSSEQAVLSTEKPQFIQTSRVENQGTSTFLNSNKPQQPSISLFPTSTSIVAHSPISSLSSQTNTHAGLDEISPSHFRSTKTQPAHGVSSPFIVSSHSESSKFNGQTLGSGDSYVYNKPLITFDIPSGRPYTASQGPFFINKPQDLISPTQQQIQPEFSKYPQESTSDLIKPTLATSNYYYKDGNRDNIYQTNGVTQASISPFPSIVPTSASVLFTTPTLSAFPQVGSTIATSTAQFISTNLGDQTYNVANQPQYGQHTLEPENKFQNSGAQSKVQNYNGEVYEYNKPAMKSFASPQTQSFQTAKFNNTPQFGQHIPNTHKLSSSQISQQSTPSQIDALTSSKSEYETAPLQFGTKTGSFFDQRTTPSRSNEQASLPFGQKSTPPNFDLQKSLSVGSQITSSRFGVQNTPSVGQKTPPSRISGSQTSTSVGPQITQSFGTQSAGLFGQKTTPSSFGVQTSPSFGLQTSPTRFGAQTNLSFGQQITSPFGDQPNASLGQQTPPSRLGTQTGSLYGSQTAPSIFDLQSGPFGQKISSIQFGRPPRPTDDYQTTASRFDEQTGTSVEQGILPLFDHKKPANQQSSSTVSQKEFFSNANQKNDAHDLNTKPASFNFKPSTSQQSGSISPQQSQSSGQSDRDQDFTSQHINNIAPDRQQVLNQSNKQFDNNFQSNLGTQPENQINPQSVSGFQKGETVKPTKETEFASKPINSQVPQNVQKFGNDRLPSQAPGLLDIRGVDSQNQNGEVAQTTFIRENLPNLKPFGSRPQSSFKSVCCADGFRNDNKGFSQNPSGDGSIDLPNTSFGTGDLGFTKKENQGIQEPQSGSRGPTANSNIGSQSEPTHSTGGRGEQFGGPREPPRFDATGYHY